MRLLVATRTKELYDRLRTLWPECEQCPPERVEAGLRNPRTEAVLVTVEGFEESLPELVRRWKSLRPHVQIVLLFRKAPGTRAVVGLMRAGVYDVIDAGPGPMPEQRLKTMLEDLARRLEEVRQGSLERLQVRESVAFAGLVGESPQMRDLMARITQAAWLACPVLIHGEPGSGKRLAAHAIHALSARNGHPLVTVDCGSMPSRMLEAELCGIPGAGWHDSRLFAAAQGGTLLLHEVSEIPAPVQIRLLRLLESIEQGEAPVAGVRLISTTNYPLEPLLESDLFRMDLYYRLNVMEIAVPALRERPQDVAPLARHFLVRHTRQGRGFVLAEDAAAALAQYPWPGNVRELKTAVEYAVSHSRDNTITAASLPPGVTGMAVPEAGFDGFDLERLEQRAIRRALEASGYDRKKAARLLGIGKTTLYRKLRRLGVTPGTTRRNLVM